jgi:hypothetical protein
MAFVTGVPSPIFCAMIREESERSGPWPCPSLHKRGLFIRVHSAPRTLHLTSKDTASRSGRGIYLKKWSLDRSVSYVIVIFGVLKLAWRKRYRLARSGIYFENSPVGPSIPPYSNPAAVHTSLSISSGVEGYSNIPQVGVCVQMSTQDTAWNIANMRKDYCNSQSTLDADKTILAFSYHISKMSRSKKHVPKTGVKNTSFTRWLAKMILSNI